MNWNESPRALEEDLNDVRRDRLENNARGSSAIRPFVEGILPKFTDKHGHVLVDELASAISHEYDVNFKPARRRLKLLGYHRAHGWELDFIWPRATKLPCALRQSLESWRK